MFLNFLLRYIMENIVTEWKLEDEDLICTYTNSDIISQTETLEIPEKPLILQTLKEANIFIKEDVIFKNKFYNIFFFVNKDKIISVFINNTYFSGLSNELKIPIDDIMSNTKLLLDTNSTNFQQKYINAINDSLYSLVSITNDIADYFYINEHVDINITFTNLEEVIKKSISIVSGSHKINYILDEIKYIFTDSKRLTQVLVNLFRNFLDLSSINLRVDIINNKLRFSISNVSNVINNLRLNLTKKILKIMGSEFYQKDNIVYFDLQYSQDCLYIKDKTILIFLPESKQRYKLFSELSKYGTKCFICNTKSELKIYTSNPSFYINLIVAPYSMEFNNIKTVKFNDDFNILIEEICESLR